jgi:protein phosphatase
VCIDTGCVFGGKLTAFSYPERAFVSVKAKKVYYEANNPLKPKSDNTGGTLLLGDVSGKLHISTRLVPSVDVHEDNAAAALELMSRFAIDPRWLIYLPPTMSPCESSNLDDYLEHPVEAFEYFRRRGAVQVVCEKKHMGSRAVIVICASADAAKRRFGIDERGVIYTRTGRRFFDDKAYENEIFSRLEGVLSQSGFWDDFKTDWVCLDVEVMPWSAKAQELIKRQYAPVACAGGASLEGAVEALESFAPKDAGEDDVDIQKLLEEFKARKSLMEKYKESYGRYCWTVDSVDDLRIAPFHLLAFEGSANFDRDHVWHMETIKKYIAQTDPIFAATDYITVDLSDEGGVKRGVDWWLELTEAGGEGMVVKPFGFIARKDAELLQPAVKCRGREYLRIIYGPEYTLHLKRLKKRGLSRKRQLAIKEAALGVESLERFVAREPLHRVHECAFAVLALESEPVDPRL